MQRQHVRQIVCVFSQNGVQARLGDADADTSIGNRQPMLTLRHQRHAPLKAIVRMPALDRQRENKKDSGFPDAKQQRLYFPQIFFGQNKPEILPEFADLQSALHLSPMRSYYRATTASPQNNLLAAMLSAGSGYKKSRFG
jgi:hypothetical protein